MALSRKLRVAAMASAALGSAGVKIMILVDAKGMPVPLAAPPANPAECGLIQELFGFMIPEVTPAKSWMTKLTNTTVSTSSWPLRESR
jgi:hypothetical protein